MLHAPFCCLCAPITHSTEGPGPLQQCTSASHYTQDYSRACVLGHACGPQDWPPAMWSCAGVVCCSAALQRNSSCIARHNITPHPVARTSITDCSQSPLKRYHCCLQLADVKNGVIGIKYRQVPCTQKPSKQAWSPPSPGYPYPKDFQGDKRSCPGLGPVSNDAASTNMNSLGWSGGGAGGSSASASSGSNNAQSSSSSSAGGNNAAWSSSVSGSVSGSASNSGSGASFGASVSASTTGNTGTTWQASSAVASTVAAYG